MAYAYCSSKDCDYVKSFAESVPPPKFCKKCSSPMIVECPNCERPIYDSDATFCSNCGKPYK